MSLRKRDSSSIFYFVLEENLYGNPFLDSKQLYRLKREWLLFTVITLKTAILFPYTWETSSTAPSRKVYSSQKIKSQISRGLFLGLT